MKPETVIKIDNLCVGYNGRDILHDISMEIPKGVFLPFVGPNGAGKTTLLRAILGLIKPRSGNVRMALHRWNLGYVPQHRDIDPLYPVKTWQIVMMGIYRQLGLWRKPNRAEEKHLHGVMDRLGLLEHRHKTFGELSGGMKQKTLIARALAGGPEVLVLDEPTSELDEASEKETLRWLADLSRQEGKTVLLAHHGYQMLKGLAKMVCLVKHGTVALVPTAETGKHSGSIENAHGHLHSINVGAHAAQH